MKKLIIVGPVCLLAASCASTNRSVPIVDDAGYTHYTMSYQSDTKGSMYFPAKRQATGRKVFIFDRTKLGLESNQEQLVQCGSKK